MERLPFNHGETDYFKACGFESYDHFAKVLESSVDVTISETRNDPKLLRYIAMQIVETLYLAIEDFTLKTLIFLILGVQIDESGNVTKSEMVELVENRLLEVNEDTYVLIITLSDILAERFMKESDSKQGEYIN